MPSTLTKSPWLFPSTREVQFDEKWSFVNKKQKNFDPANPPDDHKGDWWDQAIDRKVVPRSLEAVERALKASVCGRTIKTSFVERQHGTNRGLKAWKAYRFKGLECSPGDDLFSTVRLQLFLAGADAADT